ncbi:MAG: hypothetical protein FWC55_10475 [Firmicutes bacterium]|nr:hypothetical protein [Bacillota bacterium]
MTGFERTMAALSGERTDRPPFDFWAEDAALNRLFAYLGHRDIDLFLDKNSVDIREFRAVEPPAKDIGGGFYENMWGERYTFRRGEWGDAREDTYGALCRAESLEEIAAFRWPDNDAMDYGRLREQVRAARDKKLAVRYGFADIWQRPSLVRGLENHLLDMCERPGWTHWLSRKFTDFYLEDYRRAWEASGGQIDIFLVISDVGSQRGPMISGRMFGEFVAPYLSEMAEAVHRLGARLMFHSCGNVAGFIPSFIRCGVDILNPIQPVGPEMSPEALRAYGGRICFHGGIDVQRLLPSGTPEEVKREVRRYAGAFGAGYIACPAHMFQPDTPAENIEAFYRAFQ